MEEPKLVSGTPLGSRFQSCIHSNLDFAQSIVPPFCDVQLQLRLILRHSSSKTDDFVTHGKLRLPENLNQRLLNIVIAVSKVSAAKTIIMIDVIDDGDVQYLVLVQIDERDLSLFRVEIREGKNQQSQQCQYESRRFHRRS